MNGDQFGESEINKSTHRKREQDMSNTNKPSESNNELGGVSTRHEGEHVIHGQTPGAVSIGLGEVVLAATRFQPLPTEAMDQLIREASDGSMPALYALLLRYSDQMDVSIPPSLQIRSLHLAEQRNSLAWYAVGKALYAEHLIGEGRTNKGYRLLKKASRAGIPDASWMLAKISASRGKSDALPQARLAALAGYIPAVEALAFNEPREPIAPRRTAQSRRVEEVEGELKAAYARIDDLKSQNDVLIKRTAAAEAEASSQSERIKKDATVVRYHELNATLNAEIVELKAKLDRQSKELVDAEGEAKRAKRMEEKYKARLLEHRLSIV